jgi:hypothetical protein
MKAQGKMAYDTTTAMQRFEEAWPSPTPEQALADAKRTLAVLSQHDALDLAPLLGLDS